MHSLPIFTPLPILVPSSQDPLSVLRPDVISQSLGLAAVVVRAIRVGMAVVAVAAVLVVVTRVLWSDVLELVDGAALRAALDWAVARGRQPQNGV